MSDSERIDKLEKIVESNARAIEALANEWQKDREEWKKDRKQMYEWMARLGRISGKFLGDASGLLSSPGGYRRQAGNDA